jgi:hypothetical protein
LLAPGALVALLIGGIALSFAGCARVKPWQRGRLASPAMQSMLASGNAVDVGYRAKVLESKTGGGLPGTAPGGGCGCTQ